MPESEPQQQPPVNSEPVLNTYEDVAQMVDFPLLAPAFTEAQISDGCDLARSYRLGSITVRPSDAQLAVKWLDSSGVTVASVAGFPHGYETTAAKIYAVRDLISRGVGEIETTLNAGKMASRQFQYVEMELMQLAEECHKGNVKLRVTVENHWLAHDMKVIGYKILKRAGADSVRAAGVFGPAPYSMDDIKFMAEKFKDRLQLDAGRGAKTLDDVKALYKAGCTRLALIQPAPVLDAWKAELAARPEETPISDTAGTSPS